MIPFVHKKQKEEDPEVVKGYNELQGANLRLNFLYPKLVGNWYYFYGFYEFLMHFSYLAYCSAYIGAIWLTFVYEDPILFPTSLCLGVLTLVYSIVAHNILYRREVIDRMFKCVGQGFVKYYRPLTPVEQALVQECKDACRRNTILYSWIAVVLIVFQLLIPPLPFGIKGDYSTIKEGGVPINGHLAVPLYLPFKTDTAVTFWTVYAVVAHNGAAACLIMSSACALYCNLCIQLKLLKYSLDDIENRAIYLYESRVNDPNNLEIYDDPIFHQCMNDCLNENIKHHQILVDFYRNLQKLTSISLSAILSGAALQISAPMLQLMRSEEIYHAFYDTKWWNADQKFRKKLALCLLYADKPFELWAMGIVNASHQTLLNVLKTSFSYFNFLIAAQLKYDALT
ncbi:7tm Odorant receptor [Nesidiocoris tenuis]|uniref:Odorant receptor n=1 Tax=Nesidiocoris tenuis TaxID=355587 RepID=A0ABN7AWN5_9HEMI|nr:7tm Odorant receptor [Nesidiocoris tenuis]